MKTGWDESAEAWIAVMAEDGDFSRKYVLDKPMLERVRAGDFKSALDVGCGEGRFSRMLRAAGIQTVGIDPTEILIDQARRRDPDGDYRLAAAENLPFADASFDLVVSYLSLIDIPDAATAISEMARVLKPGGRLLIANLTSFGTAGHGWSDEPEPRFCIDRYLEIRELLSEWKGIRITNWHRPLSYYMQLLLCEGLLLRHFDEPPAHGGDPATVAKYQRVPWLLMMEWEKP
jgi:SAM-dependent methyltransferase